MKVRESNYELMRIVSMFLIVVFHILYHGKVLEHTTGGLHLFLTLLLCFTLVHVNSFVLLMGYFNYKKEFSIKKFLKLFNSAWFYQVVIVIILLLFGLNVIGSSFRILEALSPLNYSYWFVVCYLIVYILSPFFNHLIADLNQKQHRKLLIILIVLFSIIPFITDQDLIFNNGFTIVQFSLLYFLGAYLKKYPLQDNYHFKNYSKNKFQTIMFCGIFLFTVLHFGIVTLGDMFWYYENPFLHQIGVTFRADLFSYSSIFVILQTICYFLWFGTLTIKSKVINGISGLVFGVYLIHDNEYLKLFIYKWLGLDNGSMIYNPMIIIYILVGAIVIYFVCSIIEFIRQKIFKFIGNRKISKKISNKFYKYIENF